MSAGARGPGEAERTLAQALEARALAFRREMGVPVPAVEGKLLRPQVAMAAAGSGARDPELGARVEMGALAIQAVHEASLLHDDILDGCAERRGRPSMAARAGEAAALVEGDHLLTTAYRMAAATGSLPFVQAFARAVERTVAGEKAQARAAGRWLTEPEYREIVEGKSGELFGVAVALAAHLQGDAERARRDEALGVRMGCLYQMVDDFLDLCPGAELGKPPLQDLAQAKWSWPLAWSGATAFPEGETATRAFVESLFTPAGTGEGRGASPMRQALRYLEVEAEGVSRAWKEAHPADAQVPALLESWVGRARETLAREEGSRRGDGPEPEDALRRPLAPEAGSAEAMAQLRALALEVGGADGWERTFARHGRSFRFAARLFPPEPGRLVAGVYAFCRFADDLVDEAPDQDPAQLALRLAALDTLVLQGWESADTGIPLLDQVLGETAARGVGPHHARELLRGIAMDLEPRVYPDLPSLRQYSYRVASVVGLWLTELFGNREASVLRRAEALGHAMQLTNILRDVGEDWRRGRLYLPRDRMVAHGVTPEGIREGVEGGRIPEGWVPLMEELMAVADAEYDLAFEAIPALPPFFQRPVAVAARVYQGIHREIRARGHDNLTGRAWTGAATKLRLGGGALLELRRARRRHRERGARLLPLYLDGRGTGAGLAPGGAAVTPLRGPA